MDCRIGQKNVCLLKGCAFKWIGEAHCKDYDPQLSAQQHEHVKAFLQNVNSPQPKIVAKKKKKKKTNSTFVKPSGSKEINFSEITVAKQDDWISKIKTL